MRSDLARYGLIASVVAGCALIGVKVAQNRSEAAKMWVPDGVDRWILAETRAQMAVEAW